MLFLVHTKPAKPRESREIREVRDCIVYVPILKTLQRLLENEDVVAQVNKCYVNNRALPVYLLYFQIYRGHSSQHPGVISDYCDGQNSVL